MEPQDDPEARIRDLERPLADRAHSSELVTTPYETQPYTQSYPPPPPSSQYYPPPPPPGYGTPYPMPAPAKKSPTGALVFLAVAILTLMLGAAALIFFAMRPADSPVAGNPTVAGGGGPLDDVPQAPSMPVLPSGIPGLPSGLPGMPGSEETLDAGPGESVNVSGIQTVTTVTCDDGIVLVSGVANVVTVTGRCASVAVSGVNNEITVDESAALSASGFDNTIIYKSGTPQIDSVTDSNVIEQG